MDKKHSDLVWEDFQPAAENGLLDRRAFFKGGAAFAAATLTKANPMTTGFVAMKFGWTAYFVPFLMVYSPTLILFGEAKDITINVITALAGTYFASLGVVGYVVRPLNPLFRLLLCAAGIGAMIPYEIFSEAVAVNIASVILGILIIVYEQIVSRTAAVRARAQ